MVLVSRCSGFPGRTPAAPSLSPQRALFRVELLGLKSASPPDHGAPTPFAVAEQQRRLLALRKISLYVESGYGKCRAAGMAGINYTTAWRWRRRHEAGGDEALLPRQYILSGRRSQFTLLQDALDKVEFLALTTGNRREAWLKFARTADCPPELASRIRPRTGYVTQSLLNKIPLRRVPAVVLIGPNHFVVSLRQGKGLLR